MENSIPRRRPPTPKLKFPLFGNTDGLSSNTNTEGDIHPKHMMYLVGVMALFMIGYEIYKSRTSNKITKSQSGIEAMEWKGKVTKKFMGYDRPDINMFEYIDANKNNKHEVDLVNLKPGIYIVKINNSSYKIIKE